MYFKCISKKNTETQSNDFFDYFIEMDDFCFVFGWAEFNVEGILFYHFLIFNVPEELAHYPRIKQQFI